MKVFLHRPLGIGGRSSLGHRVRRIPTLMGLILGLPLLVPNLGTAAAGPVVVYKPAAGSSYQLYVSGTRNIVTLMGTERMSNAVIGDVDGNGLEDEMVYTDASTGGMGCYRIPGDGQWHPENDRAIPNAHIDAVPLTVFRFGGTGTTGRIVYKSASAGQAYSIRPDGTYRTALGRMDKAFAVDVRLRGYKGDLVWWTNGVGMRWREGLTGANHAAPYSDWIPLGGGKIVSGQPGRTIAFFASKDYNPTIYVCDRYFRFTRVDGTTWPWCVNLGSMIFGDVDTDGLSEIVFVKSASDPLQWYNVPSSGAPWSSTAVVTETNVRCGWNLHGIAAVDVSAQTGTPVSTISELKTLSDGTLVRLNAKPRTKLVRELNSASNPATTGYYIEETDRTAGIRVVGLTAAFEGQLVAVNGTLDRRNGERVIVADTQTVSTLTSRVAPISTTIKALYGTVVMTGLLVQMTGTITSADRSAGWFNLSDGVQSVKVYCVDNSYTSGQVTVTGCVGAEMDLSGNITPVLRVESQTDISPIAVASYPVWTRSSLDKVYKTDLAQPLQPAIIKAARHEHEAFQIVLRAGQSPVSSVAVAANDLISASGRIPASNVSVYLAYYIYLPDFSRDYPDPIPPYRAPFNLAAGQTQPIWVDVYVPKTAPAGDYSSSITITDANSARMEVPFTLHVHNFTLPDDWKCSTSFALRDEEVSMQHQQVIHSPEHIATVKAYYNFMLDRGVSAYNLPYGVNIFTDEGMRYLTDVRMTSFITPYSSDRTQMTNVINRYVSLGMLHKPYYYTDDEPASLDRYERIKATCNYLHSINPNFRTMVTIADFPRKTTEPDWAAGRAYSVGNIVAHYAQGYYWQPYLFKCRVAHTSTIGPDEPWRGSSWRTYWDRVNAFDYLAGYIDIFCIGSTSWPLFEAKAAERRAAGDTIWTYNWFGVARTDVSPPKLTPSIETRLQSWLNYHYGNKGMLWWCADWWRGCPNPWTNIKNAPWGYAEGLLFYPGYQVGINNGVSSTRFEVLRDGLEDHQYLWLLEQKIGRAGVLAYVDRLVTNYKTYSQDLALFASIRDEIAGAIEN